MLLFGKSIKNSSGNKKGLKQYHWALAERTKKQLNYGNRVIEIEEVKYLMAQSRANDARMPSKGPVGARIAVQDALMDCYPAGRLSRPGGRE